MLVLSSIRDLRLAEFLKQGYVGVIPTDTVYGLAASAGSEEAVARLYELKQRERKPGTLVAADVGQLITLGLDPQLLQKAERLWPNPLSVIVPTSQKLHHLDQGLGSLAVRIPAQDEIREFLEKTGPLLTSSANHPGKPPATSISEAQAYFGEHVDFYVDGGDLSGCLSSTIVRFVGDRLEVVREGAAVIDETGRVILK
ncbi:MAG TPA: L-threonylcarbamoyladenylate synthase [Candidatus Saccharimonadales bacterium]